jgi:hypothetical protein
VKEGRMMDVNPEEIKKEIMKIIASKKSSGAKY